MITIEKDKTCIIGDNNLSRMNKKKSWADCGQKVALKE